MVAAESGWPAYLLEKDIWVVWALQILGTDQQLLQSLTFKGGTSLSKAHGLIDRFSEDVDLTVNIQHLWPDVDLAPAVNPSQAERRRKTADSKLKQWVSEIPMPLLQGALSAAGLPVELTLKAAEPRRRHPPTVVLHYPPLIPPSLWAPTATCGPRCCWSSVLIPPANRIGRCPSPARQRPTWPCSISRLPGHW